MGRVGDDGDAVVVWAAQLLGPDRLVRPIEPRTEGCAGSVHVKDWPAIKPENIQLNRRFLGKTGRFLFKWTEENRP